MLTLLPITICKSSEAHSTEWLLGSSLLHSCTAGASASKLKHLWPTCRKAKWELLRSSPNVTEQARDLQAELREMQQRMHALHVVAWQRMLPAPAMEL